MVEQDHSNTAQSPEDTPAVNLALLLETILATEELWEELPEPGPLFLREAAEIIEEALGVAQW